ncbi:hypothetical protein SLA2020_430890 [Shorea laevis]
MVRKRNIRRAATTYWTRIRRSFRSSSSSSRWDKTTFQRESSSISRRYSFIQYRTIHSSHINSTKLFSNPFDYRLVLADLNIGVFLWIAVASIAPIGLLMSGYGSNNKYSFLGGLRAAAQSISYEIPLTLCVLSIALRAIR